MTVQNLKELSRLIDLCRKKGIDSIQIDNISLHFGALPRAKDKAVKAAEREVSSSAFYDYTPDEILNWSSASLDEVM